MNNSFSARTALHCMTIVAAVALHSALSASAQTVIRFNGQTAGDTFGWAAMPAGDVNDDGFIDILIGAPTNDAPADFAGRCYLFHGPFSGPTIPASQANAVFTAQAFGDNLGVAVAAAGDHNGDGFGDIVMGARGHDQPGIQAGRVYLFNGPVSGTRPVTQANAIFTAADFDELGWALQGDFDLNGDQIDDLAIGAPFAENIGKAHVFFGPHAATQTTAQADFTVLGVLSFEDLGSAVAAGDLNNDGHDDLVVGAPHGVIDPAGPGRAYVFFGPQSGTVAATAADVLIEGEAVFDFFGLSLAVGDVNGDEADDLVVGADQFFNDGTGRAYVFHGPLESGIFSATTADAVILSGNSGGIANFNLGKSVGAPGDVNGDGVGDVLVGDPNADVTSGGGGFRSGAAYVFHGPLSGTIAAATADQRITGAPGDMLGHTVAGAGDLDANGAADLLLGGPADSFSTTQPGLVRLVLSSDPCMRGDANCDGDTNFFDIDPFLTALFDPPAYQSSFCDGRLCAADTDCSDAVDFFDIDPLLACLFSACPPCP